MRVCVQGGWRIRRLALTTITDGGSFLRGFDVAARNGPAPLPMARAANRSCCLRLNLDVEMARVDSSSSADGGGTIGVHRLSCEHEASARVGDGMPRSEDRIPESIRAAPSASLIGLANLAGARGSPLSKSSESSPLCVAPGIWQDGR